MATKVLGTSLETNDLQFLLGLARDAQQRRIVKGLFNYQLNIVDRLGITGIDNCKQLYNTWLNWITSGCKSEDIVPVHCHHGFKAKLRYAQLLYTKLVCKGEKQLAIEWRDTVTRVLRSHQVCGPTQDEMVSMWNDSIKNNITQPLEPNVLIALLRGCLGIPSRYNESCDAQDVYICCNAIRKYFDMIERIPYHKRTGFYRAMSSLVPDLQIDDYSQLLKKGPHKNSEDRTIVSIFGEGLDYQALSKSKVDCFTVHPEDVAARIQDYPEYEIFMVDKSKTLLDCVNDLNVALVDSYKNSTVRPAFVDYSLQYAPQIPQGEVPAGMSAAPGRAVLLQDKAGKARSIAIATYTVNNAFAPLHKQLYKVLGLISQDSTNQERGIRKIIEWTSDPEKYICSADLSSATDRLPVVLQAYILYRMLRLSQQRGAIKIAHNWYLIMTGTEYADPINGMNQPFRYGAGQGMGVYTSWAMLAITNHVMARVADWVAGNRVHQYTVCGDDIVLTCKQAFEHYETWMNSLGVKINRAKSHISEACDPNKVAEFCKRLAVNGHIVSADSPKLVIRASRKSGKPFHPAAVEYIHNAVGPLSNKKLTKLVGYRLDNRRLYLPFRYGGWGQINSEPFHEVLLKDNFIYLYIYKMMRSHVNALGNLYPGAPQDDQASIDACSRHVDANPYRTTEKDWRLMGRKVYTPISLCQDYLYEYEQFITGHARYTPSELCDIVRDTFSKLKEAGIPLRLSTFEDDDVKKSNLAIEYQRMYTRAQRNIQNQKVHTYSGGVQSVSIDLNWEDEYLVEDKRDFVLTLDSILFTE